MGRRAKRCCQRLGHAGKPWDQGVPGVGGETPRSPGPLPAARFGSGPTAQRGNGRFHAADPYLSTTCRSLAAPLKANPGTADEPSIGPTFDHG